MAILMICSEPSYLNLTLLKLAVRYNTYTPKQAYNMVSIDHSKMQSQKGD